MKAAALAGPLLLAGCLATQPIQPTRASQTQPRKPPSTVTRPPPDRAAAIGADESAATTTAGGGLSGAPRFSPTDEMLIAMGQHPRDLPLRSLLQPGRNPQRLLKAQPTAQDYQPSSVRSATYAGPDGRHVEVAQGQIAECAYERELVHFWFRVRPDLPPAVLTGVSDARRSLFDAAVTQCPATIGAALHAGLGDGVDQRIEQARSAFKEKWDRLDAQSQARRDAEVNARTRWKDGAAVLQPARVAELQRRIDNGLKQLEAATPVLNEQPASRNTPPAEALKTRVSRELHPLLLELAKSAWAEARALPAGEAGRAAFDAWDRGAAGAVMSSIGRLQRLWPDGWWSLDLVGAIEADLSRLYEAQLADKPVLDGRARQQVAQALAQRRIAADSARAEPPQALAAAPAGVKRVVFLTPGELAAYRIGQDIGRGMKDALQARAKAQQAVEDLDRNLKQSRGAFWSCWQRRCPEIADRYLDYSRWLKEKDWYQLTRYAIEASVATYSSPKDPGMAQMLSAFMGLRTVDRGPQPSCQKAFDRWIAPVGTFVQTTLRRNPFDIAGIQAFSDRLLGGPEHLAYQSCRDAMEFVYRPRQSPA